MIIAVRDRSPVPAVRPNDARVAVSGLALVAALCTRWGSLPTGAGKTLWTLITGADNGSHI